MDMKGEDFNANGQADSSWNPVYAFIFLSFHFGLVYSFMKHQVYDHSGYKGQNNGPINTFYISRNYLQTKDLGHFLYKSAQRKGTS